jgi:hypothetical protein
MGCALLVPLGVSPDGQRVAEIGAFCVDVVFRGTGRGDSLLDYVEQVRGRAGAHAHCYVFQQERLTSAIVVTFIQH